MDVPMEAKDVQVLREQPLVLRWDVMPFGILHFVVIVGGIYAVFVEHLNWHLFLLMFASLVSLHVVALLSSTWSVRAHAFFRFFKAKDLSSATHVLVHPTDVTLRSEMCKLNSISKSNQTNTSARFIFQRLPYEIYEIANRKLELRLEAYPTRETLRIYRYDSDHSGLDDKTSVKLASKFGDNDITIPAATFRELFIQQITSPMFVFQVFCMILYMLDDYWYYSLVTLVMLLFIEHMTVKQRLKNYQELRAMRPTPYKLRVFRNRKWEWLDSTSLVPGDIVSLTRSRHAEHKVPADVVVLSGTCVVNESVLTGEAIPLRKEGIDSLLPENDNFSLHDIPDPKRYCVFAGTVILQTTPVPKERAIKPRDAGCLCFVLRTGFATQEGTLVRTFLASREQASANTSETLIIILFLLLFAFAAAGYIFYNGIQAGRKLHTLIIECLLVITSVIPPELPLQLSLAITNALKAIGIPTISITCTEPFRIPMAGRANVVCFDKTGTLTEDIVEFQGFLAPDKLKSSASADIVDDIESDDAAGDDDDNNVTETGIGGGFRFLRPGEILDRKDHILEMCLAACTDTVDVDNEQVGDPLEMAVLSALGWRCQRETVTSRISKLSVRKLHSFPFSSSLKRMSVIFESQDMGTHIVCKGAAEVLKDKFSSVPSQFDKTYRDYGLEGKRVLAIGYKRITKMKKWLARDDAEKDLIFLGFLVLGSPLKPDTRKVIKQLVAASHHIVMITGDSAGTACYVAKRTRIVSRAMKILDRVNERFLCFNAEQVDNVDEWSVLSKNALVEVYSSHDICLTGNVVSWANLTGLLSEFVPYVKVFARTTPRDKSSIVQAYKATGHGTIMCGDGTNDVGALKVADAGIALVAGSSRPLSPRKNKQGKKRKPLGMRERALKQLQEELELMNQEDTVPKLGDASIAAAFTSKISSCSCVIHLIRQGRATLVISNQMIQILALNCLINAFCLSVLYLEGIKLSDTQMTISGIAIAMSMYLVSAARAQKKLSPQLPRHSSVTHYMFTSVLSQFGLHIYMLLSEVRRAQLLEPSREFNPDAVDVVFRPGVTNTVVFLFLLSMQASTILISYRGKPFMQSLPENSNLLVVVGGLVFLSILGATGAFPGINSSFEIVSLPAEISEKLVMAIILDSVGSLILDRLADRLFPSSYPMLPK